MMKLWNQVAIVKQLPKIEFILRRKDDGTFAQGSLHA